MMAHQNLFAGIPEQLPEELLEDIVRTETVRIERIVSQGHASPEEFWYDQDWSEWVIVLKGKACLLFEGQNDPVTLAPGDYINIPAHMKHRVTWTDSAQETIWLAVHYKE